MDATCKTCPFWWFQTKDGVFYRSECRRSPPTVAVNARAGDPGQPVEPHWPVYPVTQPDEWCGEHPLRQRDRLAAMAMQALIPVIVDDGGSFSSEELALRAYCTADFMLKHP